MAAIEEKNPELDTIALEIFAKRSGSNLIRAGFEQQEAVAAFRQAEAFLIARGKIRRGELRTAAPTGPVLADCCAPNLPKNSPFNMVSQRFGNLAKVQQIARWLDANPIAKVPTTDPEGEKMADYLSLLNSEFPGLKWGVPEVSTAAAIFPSYCR